MANSRSRLNYGHFNAIHRNSTVGTLHEVEPDEDSLAKLGDFKLLAYFVILPSALPRLCWDFAAMLLISYDCVAIPLDLFDPPDLAFSLVMIWATRVFWTLNIPISLLTGYLKKDGTVEMRPREVAKHYSQTWLVPDISVVFIDWAEVIFKREGVGWSRLGYTLRLLRIVRVVRILRFIKAPEMMDFFNEYIRSEQVHLIAAMGTIIVVTLVVTHIIACLWYCVGQYGIQELDGQSWRTEQQMEQKSLQEQYLLAFHWSLAQTAGELIIEPENNLERGFTALVTFLAIIFSAMFVSSLTTSMTRLQLISGKQSAQLAMLRRFLLDRSISRPLATRVLQNAQYALTEQKKDVPETSVSLLALISNPLLVEVHFEIYSHMLLEHPFFQCYNYINPGGVMKVCHMAVMLFTMYQGDLLFSDFESSCKRMYFIEKGGLQYSQQRRLNVSTTKGQWMCEAFLWTQWSHCGTARASTTSRLLALDAEKFQNIISTFPTPHAQQYAELFVEALNDLEVNELTDLDMLRDELDDLIEEAFPVETEDTDSEDHDVANQDQSPEAGRMDGEDPESRRTDLLADGSEVRRNSSFLSEEQRNSGVRKSLTRRSVDLQNKNNLSPTGGMRRLSATQRHSRASLVAKKLSKLSQRGNVENTAKSTGWLRCPRRSQLFAEGWRQRCCRCRWSEGAQWLRERFRGVRVSRVAGSPCRSTVQPFQAATPDGA